MKSVVNIHYKIHMRISNNTESVLKFLDITFFLKHIVGYSSAVHLFMSLVENVFFYFLLSIYKDRVIVAKMGQLISPYRNTNSPLILSISIIKDPIKICMCYVWNKLSDIFSSFLWQNNSQKNISYLSLETMRKNLKSIFLKYVHHKV